MQRRQKRRAERVPGEKEREDSKMKRAVKILEILFLIGMLLMCGAVILAGNGKIPYIFGYRILQVVSDSMQPTISDETCIAIKQVKKEEIHVGDIITFVSDAPDIRGYLNTHRVHEIIQDTESGETLFITKGDACIAPDEYPVEYEQIVGKYTGELPFGKWVYRGIIFLTDRTHYFIVVIVPLLFCCMSYFKQLIAALLGKEKDAS